MSRALKGTEAPTKDCPEATKRVSDLQSGKKVFAIGNALNHGLSSTEGIIGIPPVRILIEGKERVVMQSDMTIIKGNRREGLFNEKGMLVGMPTFRLKDNSGNIQYGPIFSILAHSIRDTIQHIPLKRRL